MPHDIHVERVLYTQTIQRSHETISAQKHYHFPDTPPPLVSLAHGKTAIAQRTHCLNSRLLQSDTQSPLGSRE